MPETCSRDDVMAWLEVEAKRCRSPADLLTQLADRLSRTGPPLQAMTLEVATLHPLMAGAVLTWDRDRPSALEAPIFHDPFGGDQATAVTPRSPYQERRDASPARSFDIAFSDGSRHELKAVAAATAGFNEEEIDGLAHVVRALAAPLEILVLKEMTSTLMTTYLGARTAERVLSGTIRRGDCDGVHAVLWYSDLRGFTALSQGQAGDAVIAMLNGHFERLVAPIKAFGGEVLKFMGDGLLAIFPVDEVGSTGQACERAIRSVRAARAGMASFDAERRGQGLHPLEFGVALHVGDVMYGNIGAPDRLDFTVIGPAVNLASRLEAMCKPLNRPVLASPAFEDACETPLISLGDHRLADMTASIEVFTLEEFAAAV